MEAFNNCRICLETINHEPIKMTRAIIKFLESAIRMEHIARKFEHVNPKLNLCAACFNKLSEFQDFHEQCKEANDFWKTQFPSRKEENCGDVSITITDNNQVDQENTGTKTSVDINNMISQKYEIHLEEAEYQESKTTEDEDDEVLLSLPVTTMNYCDGSTERENQNVDVNVEKIDGDEDWHANNDENSEIDMVNGGDASCEPENYKEDQAVEEYEFDELCEENVIQEEDFINATLDTNQKNMVEKENSAIKENTTFVYAVVDDDDGSGSCSLIQEYTVQEGKATMEVPAQTVGASSNTYIVRTVLDDNGKLKKSYQCQHCDRCFDRIYDIESHYNIHTDVKPYKCNICGKSFRQKNILTTHQAALHFGKKIECDECGKKFARRSQLILHYRMHRDEKPFVCEYEDCKAAFRQRQHLVDHLFIHTNTKNFQCPTCDKAFQTRKRLQDHIYKVHSYHRYVCNKCDKMFLKPHMLKNHLKNHHKIDVDDVSHLKVIVDPAKQMQK
ncbi:uncharacterized protein LOC142230711 [Haematobia irritans]|uniref:uncharacterized protein LOC142230711 n=1 Tax=Haematobia irritans TaxID=7368 RepID=UPI003F4FAFC4